MDDFSRISSWVAQLGDANISEPGDDQYDFLSRTVRRHSDNSGHDYYPGDYHHDPEETYSEADLMARLEDLTDSSDDDDHVGTGLPRVKRPPPAWFTKQTFQYNTRMVFVALPGLILILALAGDLFLTIATLGAFVIYLLQEAELKPQALTAYIVTFACCQVSIIYSAFPLLWLSVFNIFLLCLLNVFSVLTGAWISLNFLEFCSWEPEFVKVLETMLFTIYPGISIALWTWIVTSVTCISLAPYCVLVFGFIILQQFLTPTPSSYVKQTSDHNQDLYIIDCQLVGAMALAYIAITPTIYLLVAASGGVATMFTLYTVGEWVFVVSLTIFCATLMNVRAFLEAAEISGQTLLQARWCSGLLSLLLLSVVLHKHHFTLYLIPWISMGVAVHAAYGFVVGQKRLKKWSFITGLLLLSMYGIIFSKLPWAVHYYISGGLHISVMHVALLTNVALCILSAYVSVTGTAESFGLVFTLQNLCFVTCEKLLANNDMYSSALIAVSACISLYVIIRLSIAHKLPEMYAWVLCSLQLTKLSDHCDMLIQSPTEPSQPWWNLYGTLATLIVTLTLTKILLMDLPQKLTLEKYVTLMGMSLLAVSFSMPVFGYKICYVIERTEPTVADLIGLILIVESLLSIRLYITSGCMWKGAKHVGPAALMSALVILHLQPDMASMHWSELKKWLLVINIIASFIVIPLAAMVKAPKTLGLLSTVLGAPLGFSMAIWFFPGGLSSTMYTLYCWSAILCTSFILTATRQPHYLQKHIVYRCTFVALLCILLVTTDYFIPTPAISIQPGAICTVVTLLIIAGVCKALSYTEKSADLLAAEPTSEYKNTALPGNILTVTLYIILLQMWDHYYYDLWVIFCSTSLLLLQADPHMLSEGVINRSAAPFTITTLALLSSSYYHNQLWEAISTYQHFLGYVDFTITSLLLFVHITFISVLWTDRPIISDRWTVFMTPMASLYIFFATSYGAYLLGVFSVAVSLWLIKYKLELKVNRP